MMNIDILIKDSKIFTANQDNPVITDGAIAISDDKIVWIGQSSDIPQSYMSNAQRLISLPTGWITPGLIDCHTHLVYGGNRASEFRRQLEGESYEQISASGGGILSTVDATRIASEDVT